MTSIQPQLWIAEARSAVAFYEAAFDAKTLHLVGDDDDIVAQLAVGHAVFWVSNAAPAMKRLDPRAIGGATGRVLLVVDDPRAVLRQAIAAGATEISPYADEHGWQLGRVIDPFGHEWEIGRPVVQWPPHEQAASVPE